MIKNQILAFIFRWLVSSVGMYLCITFFATIDGNTNSFWLYAAAGLVFSIVNSVVRPLATLLSLRLIILSMGIFTFIINVAMMAITTWIVPGIHMDIMDLIFSTILMSVLNWLISII